MARSRLYRFFGRKGMEEDHYHAYGEDLELLSADYRKAFAPGGSEHRGR